MIYSYNKSQKDKLFCILFW